MTVIDRIRADHLAVQAGASQTTQESVAAADAHLAHAGVPTYSELVATLLTWNRTSDAYKAVRHAAHLGKRVRTAFEQSEVCRLEGTRRDTTHAVNNLIDRLPRGL